MVRRVALKNNFTYDDLFFLCLFEVVASQFPLPTLEARIFFLVLNVVASQFPISPNSEVMTFFLFLGNWRLRFWILGKSDSGYWF